MTTSEIKATIVLSPQEENLDFFALLVTGSLLHYSLTISPSRSLPKIPKEALNSPQDILKWPEVLSTCFLFFLAQHITSVI